MNPHVKDILRTFKEDPFAAAAATVVVLVQLPWIVWKHWRRGEE